VKILSFSYCFPSGAHRTWGLFVQQRLAALGRRLELQAVSPIGVFPFVSRLRRYPGPPREQWDGMTVHRPRFFYFPGVLKWLDGPLYGHGLRRWLENLCGQWKPDLLDAHFVWPDGVGVSLLARRMKIPYVITLRGKIYPCLDVRSQRRQCARALRGAAAVISVSGPMAKVALELGVAPDRMHVIGNGVNTEMFRPRDKAQARAELGLPAHGRLITTVAHLGARKGHHETIKALGKLPQNVRLVLVGDDQKGTKSSQVLRRLTSDLGLDGRVIFAGPQPYDRIPLYFNAADVSVLASYREGCPNVVLESLACGTAVVATNVGAVPELLSVPGDGRIVPPRDVNALAKALEDVLNSSGSALSLASGKAVKSWDEVARQVHQVFADVLSPLPTSTTQETPR